MACDQTMNSADSRLLRSFLITAGAFLTSLVILYLFLDHREGYGLFDLLRGKHHPPMPASAGSVDATPEKTPGDAAPDPDPAPGPASAPASPASSGTEKTSATDAAPPATEVEDLRLAQSLSRLFNRIVAKVMPSVVSIHTSKQQAYDIVRVDPSGRPRYEDREYHSQPGVGSGIIVSEDGQIITNHHVIRDLDLKNGRDQIFVTIYGEEAPREVSVIGVNRGADLAVLQLKGVNGKKFPTLPWGDSDQITRGDIVLTFGAPFGLTESVTQGIISKTHRRLGEADQFPDYIQTDAAINPGNSGGPLVNLRGEIIGMNWAIYSGQSEVRVFQGIGLALPSNNVRDTFERLIATDRPKGYIGISLMELPEDALEKGAGISAVDMASPADLAGLREGDVITTIDSTPILKAGDAEKCLQRKKVGDRVEFRVSRNLESLPPMQLTVLDVAKTGQPEPLPSELPGLKVRVKDYDLADWGRMLSRGWSHGRRFILVAAVPEDSPVAGKLSPGDVIRGFNGKPTATVEDLLQAMHAAPATEEFSLAVWRDLRTQFELRIKP
jgi:serine protease Do